MARLITDGFETQKFSAAGATDPEGLNTAINGAPTISTTTVRSGNASFLCAADARYKLYPVPGSALSRPYYFRTYFQKSANVANATNIVMFQDSGFTVQHRLLLNTNGTVALQNSAFGALGSASSALSNNTWYRLEVLLNVSAAGADTYEFRVDGVSIASGTSALSANAPAFIVMGCSGGTPTANLFFDDVALNDDQTGGAQTSWPGDGKVVLLAPISDASRTGFTGGGGGTTNLFDANNNYPPTGVISTGTNASQNGSATSNTTDNYTVNLGAYTTAVASGGGGLGGSDTVTLVQALARGGNSTTTSRNFGIQSTAEPVIAETTQGTGTTAAGTEVTGWTTARTAVSYAPSVTLGNSPILEFRKATASTDRLMCDMLGLYVEYVPATSQNIPLGASALQFSSSLALSAPTQIPLGASSLVTTPTLAVSAQTQVPLGASSLAVAPTLAVSAPTRISLGAASLTTASTFALRAPTQVPLGAAALLTSTSLTFTGPTQIPLGASALALSDSLALSVPTQIPLGTSALVVSTSAALKAGTVIPFGPSHLLVVTSLDLTAPTAPLSFTFGPGLLRKFPAGTLVGLYESVDIEDPPQMRKTGEPLRDSIANYTVTDPLSVTNVVAGRRYYIAALVSFEEKRAYFTLTHHEWRYLYFVP